MYQGAVPEILWNPTFGIAWYFSQRLNTPGIMPGSVLGLKQARAIELAILHVVAPGCLRTNQKERKRVAWSYHDDMNWRNKVWCVYLQAFQILVATFH